MVTRHNSQHQWRERGAAPMDWPCYDGTERDGWIDAMIAALTVTGPVYDEQNERDVP